MTDSDEPRDAEAVLRSIAKLLAPYVRDVVEQEQRAPQFYDQGNSPLGKRRHLTLARKGVLPSHKLGRKVLIATDEVHRFIEEQARQTPTHDAPDDVLAEWGLRPRR